MATKACSSEAGPRVADVGGPDTHVEVAVQEQQECLVRGRAQQQCVPRCRSLCAFPKDPQRRALAFVLLLRAASTLMLRRAAAALLLFLSASPFTAPFATCDVSTLFGQHTTAAQLEVEAPHAATDDHAQALAAVARRERVRHYKSLTIGWTMPFVEVPAPPRLTRARAAALDSPPAQPLTARTHLRI